MAVVYAGSNRKAPTGNALTYVNNAISNAVGNIAIGKTLNGNSQ